jgi:hypothetical protein
VKQYIIFYKGFNQGKEYCMGNMNGTCISLCMKTFREWEKQIKEWAQCESIVITNCILLDEETI